MSDPWNEYNRLVEATSRWAQRGIIGVLLTGVAIFIALQWSRSVAAVAAGIGFVVLMIISAIGLYYSLKRAAYLRRSRHELAASQQAHVARARLPISRRGRVLFLVIAVG